MKFSLFLLVFCSSLALSAQNDYTLVNMKKIKHAVTGRRGPANYAGLLDRFNAFDTSLTLEDYRMLYYGAVFQPGFSIRPNERREAINKAVHDNDFQLVSLICDSVLGELPTSLATNYLKSFALYRTRPGREDYLKYRDRFIKLAGAILSSGDGKACETGFKVISVSDEYSLMEFRLGIDQVISQSLVGNCDLMKVKAVEEWPREQVYFDASEVLKREADLFK